MTASSTLNRRYGFIPTPGLHAAAVKRTDDQANLPTSVDLTAKMPPVVDQGQLGSCTANSMDGAMGFNLCKQTGVTDVGRSRLFIYWNERNIEGTTATDSGATIADSVKATAEFGAPVETDWPYDPEVFTHKPPAKAYTDALQFEAVQTQAVAQSELAIKAALAADEVVLVGFVVYESFESDVVAKTGVVPMPAPGESTLGGHAVCAVGYDDSTRRFRMRNSWGPGWGQGGYFTMPYEYLADPNLASDFWTVDHIGAASFPA